MRAGPPRPRARPQVLVVLGRDEERHGDAAGLEDIDDALHERRQVWDRALARGVRRRQRDVALEARVRPARLGL